MSRLEATLTMPIPTASLCREAAFKTPSPDLQAKDVSKL